MNVLRFLQPVLCGWFCGVITAVAIAALSGCWAP